MSCGSGTALLGLNPGLDSKECDKSEFKIGLYKETPVPQYSLWHCLQQPEYGSNLNVHQQRMDREDVYIPTVEYYLVIKRNEIASFVVMWMDLETVIQSEIREKNQCILMNIYGI